MYFYFELEGTYVNLLVWWFEHNWLLRQVAIVIQIKFDLIMDLLKRRNLNRFTPDDYITVKMWNTKVSLKACNFWTTSAIGN